MKEKLDSDVSTQDLKLRLEMGLTPRRGICGERPPTRIQTEGFERLDTNSSDGRSPTKERGTAEKGSRKASAGDGPSNRR